MKESLENIESIVENEQNAELVNETIEPIEEITEHQADFSSLEPSNEIIEKIEAQDLSSLKEELYEESLEMPEPVIE